MYRILLVDDEILVRDAIKENIDWKGIDCELVGDCENGKEAVEFIKKHPSYNLQALLYFLTGSSAYFYGTFPNFGPIHPF